MTFFDQRDRRLAGPYAFLAIVICGLAISVPSGAFSPGTPIPPCFNPFPGSPPKFNAGDLSVGVHSSLRHHSYRAWTLFLHNNNPSTPCHVYGFPTVQFVFESKRFVHPINVLHEDGPGHTLPAPTGGNVYFDFSVDEGRCSHTNPNLYKVDHIEFDHLTHSGIFIAHGGATAHICRARVYPYRPSP
jgi:hypothetical protein